MRRLFEKLRGRDTRECEEARARMSDYVDGELDEEGCRQVDDHVGRCVRCRRVLANLRVTLGRLRLLGESSPPGAENADEVAERVARAWREQA